ncbi:MAG: 1,4-dihydroxy-2-naphthoate octaprenyltransferase [Calditrichaeota bacterium]|nr:1,4-dihydroxy-2-naphthoate octaprenyltransferase [Calditrichota bacterium]
MASSIRAWWQAFRYHFVPPSILPAILGGVLAWAITGEFFPFYFFLVVTGVTFNHIALNMTDDYFDYKHSIDDAKKREKNPYSGGSGTLTGGVITPEQMKQAFSLGYFLTILIGLFLSAERGWIVFAIGAFGMACAYFYTAPPIRYGYHGLGEISQLINFSLTIGLGAYFVQAHSFSPEAALVVLPLGFMMFSMITINEIPDEAQDRDGRKRTLVVIFGAKTGVFLYALNMIIAYLIIILIPLFKIASFWIYLSLVTLPWLTKAIAVATKNFRDPQKLAPANLLTIRIHNLTGILLIIAYLIEGYQRQAQLAPMIVPIILLVVLYFPVALTVFFNVMPLKPAGKK